MEFTRITTQISICPQIKTSDLSEIKQAGFKAIICNRPDGESVDQPRFSEIEEAAKKAKIEVRFVPVVSMQISEEEIKAFSEALKALPRPLLAYCRSGARSAALLSL